MPRTGAPGLVRCVLPRTYMGALGIGENTGLHWLREVQGGQLGRGAEQANMRAALSWALGGGEPEEGRELAARLARWWIATGRYSEGGRFLGTALGITGAAAPQVQARVSLGAAWAAYNLGDAARAARLAGEGLACAKRAGEPQLEIWGRNLLAGLAWYAGDADQVRDLLEPSTGRLEGADRALASRAHVLLANAAQLAGDLAEYQRHGQRAVELARAAAGQEGLVLALTVAAAADICGAGISPSTQAVLDEATTVVNTHADLFTETIMRHWRARLAATVGQLDAARTELRLCRDAGRKGAVRAAEIIAPFAEARLAIATGDTAGAAVALHQAADAGRQAAIAMFVPALLASRACLAAIAGDAPAAAARHRRDPRRAQRTPRGHHPGHALLRRGDYGLAPGRPGRRRTPDPDGHPAVASRQRPHGRIRRHRAPRCPRM
jgi:hypothetical protein